MKNKIKGGLYGMLIGDALGVPYEFKSPHSIPEYNEIEMTPPAGFMRSHPSAGVGSWSDDGAQALCLLKSLLDCGKLDLNDFTDKMLDWYRHGYMAVDGKVFDIGNQTSMALNLYGNGCSPEKSGMVNPDGKGNGALMRVLPLVLWHKWGDDGLIELAHKQCLPTHGNITNQVCCALYCVVARKLMQGMEFDDAVAYGIRILAADYAGKEKKDYFYELCNITPDKWTGHGSGYVVDTLIGAFMIMHKAESYEEAVRMAIALGDDTDTTACVTGGLAGIKWGFDGIPTRWVGALRDKDTVDGLLEKVFEHHERMPLKRTEIHLKSTQRV